MPDTTGTRTEAYYGVALHELAHWTGHASRFDREFGKRFSDNGDAFEELVAEFGAVFLSDQTGVRIDLRPDHAKYLANWLAVLRYDRRAFFTAANKADEASEFLLAKVAPSRSRPSRPSFFA